MRSPDNCFKIILLIFFALSCSKESSSNGSETNDHSLGNEHNHGHSHDHNHQNNDDSTSGEQFTPDQAKWESFASKPFVGDTNSGHDPDGIGWISEESWNGAKWDGTIYNPSKMTKAEFKDAICPNGGDTIRGIREVFYQHNPFADNRNPTKAEVDEWHRIALNHVR